MLSLLVALLAPPAVAPATVASKPSLADYRADIDRCLGDLDLGRTEDAGKNAFVWHLKAPKKGKPDRVVVMKTRSKGCDGVFTVGRADLRVIAPFDKKNGGMKAFLVQNQPDMECKGDDEGGCERALLLRDAKRRYLSVQSVGQCEWPISLKALRVLPDQPSILLECAFSGGGDMYGHSLTLAHVIDGDIELVAFASTGSSQDMLDETKPGCRYGAPGHLKVIKRGKQPQIEIYEPEEEVKRTLQWTGKAFKEIARVKVPMPEGGLQGDEKCWKKFP